MSFPLGWKIVILSNMFYFYLRHLNSRRWIWLSGISSVMADWKLFWCQGIIEYNETHSAASEYHQLVAPQSFAAGWSQTLVSISFLAVSPLQMVSVRLASLVAMSLISLVHAVKMFLQIIIKFPAVVSLSAWFTGCSWDNRSDGFPRTKRKSPLSFANISPVEKYLLNWTICSSQGHRGPDGEKGEQGPKGDKVGWKTVQMHVNDEYSNLTLRSWIDSILIILLYILYT